ncbi:MAG: hypothetical protein OHK0048_14250 [Rhodoferax sp.]
MHPSNTSWILRGLGLALAGSLAACSSYGPGAAQGEPVQALMARMGAPEVQRVVNGQTRLEYPRGPMGHHTWFITLDAQGRVGQIEQVLTEARFAQVLPGQTAQAVRLLLGRPSEVQGLARNRGTVWSYRYESRPFCQWFQVEFDAQDRVRSTGYGEPPECSSDHDAMFRLF